MALESTLSDIVNKLREGRYAGEAAISTGIVLRVLRDLNWQVYDTKVVWPEYKTREGRADFALCHPPAKPRVLVEVKQPGKAEDATRQALSYAFHTGVPFVVLTDGRTWSFYLPAETGSYEERCVLKLDLYERSSLESKELLARYLEYGRVASGQALEAARSEYRERTRRATARRMLPEAWAEIVGKGDESLVRLLADAVESRAEVRPVEADVLGFLRSLTGPGVVDKGPPVKPEPTSKDAQRPDGGSRAISQKSRKPRQGTVIVAGKRHEYKSLVKAMVIVLTEFHNADDNSFLHRLAEHPKVKRRKRSVVAKSAIDIYPKSTHLRRRIGLLPDGWMVCKNFTNDQTMSLINVAIEVSGKAVEWDPPIATD